MSNDGFDYSERLGADAGGVELAAYLARRYRHSTPEEWTRRIQAGRVLLDGERAAADTVLRVGQLLVWRRPAWREPTAPTTFAILYEDADLLGVAKPAGLPTLPGGGFLESTLLNRVRSHAPDAAPLHRLGRWTSGIVLFARTHAARVGLSRQWASRTVGKRYRALASGVAREADFEVRTPIGPLPHPLLGSLHAASPAGKPASSRVTVVEQRDESFLCDVRIVTGRPHQIRIHLAASGHPLIGDPLYPPGGVPEPECRALPGDPGYLLHAAELTFRHPVTGSEVKLECRPPTVLRRLTRD